ncbi:MAG: esterase, partial [Betaproteobacteria bacterium]
DGWRALAVERVDPERYLLLLETGDEVLDWRYAARKYEGARTVIRDGGDHTLQSFGEHLPRILAFAGLTARA